MNYIQVAAGAAADLQRVIAAEEQHIPEGGLAELRVRFRVRFPGFESAAQEAGASLAAHGVKPWPGQWRLVTADAREPVWHVRWQKGLPWAWAVVAVLAAVVILVLAWFFYKVVRPVVEVIVEKYPWAMPLFTVSLVGGGILLYMKRDAVKSWLGRIGRRPGG